LLERNGRQHYPVYAAETDVPQLIVDYGDLAVSTPGGAAALYHRIRAAAVTVCRRLDEHALAPKLLNDACVQKAIADAVTKVDRPALSAVYNAKDRHPTSVVLANARSR
jgi:UrcA family protein